jgi:hypothetical protein
MTIGEAARQSKARRGDLACFISLALMRQSIALIVT